MDKVEMCFPAKAVVRSILLHEQARMRHCETLDRRAPVVADST